jgi:hypothetical protein
MRKLVLGCAVALAIAAPAQAEDGGGEPERVRTAKTKPKELRIAGTIVRLSDEAVAVENRVGDAMLTCLVPERLAAKAARFEVGDAVKMQCLRYRGRRAVLMNLRPVEQAKRPKAPEAEKPAERPAVEEPVPAAELRLYGRIAELSREAVTVTGDAGSLSCRVPAGLAEKLARFAVGDAVKMMCRGTELTYLEKTG